MAERIKRTRNKKIALMAAASVLAGASALAPAQASDVDPAASQATIEAPTPIIVQSEDQADEQKSGTVKKWTLLAAAAGALAGLVKLIGAGKITGAAKEIAGNAVRISADAAAGAGRAIARTAASPLRFAGLMAGLALFTLTGLWLFDIEWIGGLIAGAAMAGLFAYGAMKTRAVVRRVKSLK